MSRKRKDRMREENHFREGEVEKVMCLMQDHRAPQEDRGQSPVFSERKHRAGREKPSRMLFKGKARLSPRRERVEFPEVRSAYRQWLNPEVEGRKTRNTYLNAHDRPLYLSFSLFLNLYPLCPTPRGGSTTCAYTV